VMVEDQRKACPERGSVQDNERQPGPRACPNGPASASETDCVRRGCESRSSEMPAAVAHLPFTGAHQAACLGPHHWGAAA
jgi:hypothetical protein